MRIFNLNQHAACRERVYARTMCHVESIKLWSICTDLCFSYLSADLDAQSYLYQSRLETRGRVEAAQIRISNSRHSGTAQCTHTLNYRLYEPHIYHFGCTWGLATLRVRFSSTQESKAAVDS